MNSLWYGLSIVAVLLIVYWFITNDGLPDDQTRGLLAMKLPGTETSGRKRRVRGKFSLKNLR